MRAVCGVGGGGGFVCVFVMESTNKVKLLETLKTPTLNPHPRPTTPPPPPGGSAGCVGGWIGCGECGLGVVVVVMWVWRSVGVCDGDVISTRKLQFSNQ